MYLTKILSADLSRHLSTNTSVPSGVNIFGAIFSIIFSVINLMCCQGAFFLICCIIKSIFFICNIFMCGLSAERNGVCKFMDPHTKTEIINIIIEDVDQELLDEEIIHLVLDKRVSQPGETIEASHRTFGEHAADSFAKFVGSWIFICGFIVVLIIWITTNVILVSGAFDPFPFILLNLVLSCVAAIQAPLILMSQNRQEHKDRLRAENDYKVNLKSEIIMQDLHNKMDQILENQEKILSLSGGDVNTDGRGKS